jgi:hypothetical protein
MNQKRRECGAYYTTLPDLKNHPEKMFAYLRMSPELFEKLLNMVKDR